MTFEEIIAKLTLIKNGTFFTVTYKTEHIESAKARKQGFSVTKVTTIQVRKGIRYSNIKSVIQAKTENPSHSFTHSLQNGFEWHTDYPGLILSSSKTEDLLVRLYSVNSNVKPKKEYFITSQANPTPQKITEEELINLNIVNPSFSKAKQKTPCYNIYIKNIIKIK